MRRLRQLEKEIERLKEIIESAEANNTVGLCKSADMGIRLFEKLTFSPGITRLSLRRDLLDPAG